MLPKIAFLFLTMGNIYHEAPWINYFKGHESQYSLYVHPKKKISKESFFHSSVIANLQTTTWANTMKAQIALLKEALKDPNNVKFVFSSEATIPLTTFDAMYTQLTNDLRSQFSYRKNPFTTRTFDKLKEVYNNPQWLILNRKHAQLMVDDKILIKVFALRPHDQEHYPSTLLNQHNELNQIINKDATLCIWKTGNHPHEFKDLAHDPHTKKLIEIIKEQRFLFCRKFDQECSLRLLGKYLPTIFLSSSSKNK